MRQQNIFLGDINKGFTKAVVRRSQDMLPCPEKNCSNVVVLEVSCLDESSRPGKRNRQHNTFVIFMDRGLCTTSAYY
eukprot:snap_masked-scaffold_7-processed-gene-17.13-mRNA-1 protein AED:1.00 eAED:1.00 QI:0/0/0/0/1/1/2/0/76